MSGFNAYLSFVDHVKEALQRSPAVEFAPFPGLAVLHPHEPKPTNMPYLIFQPGVVEPISTWMEIYLFQARLFTPRSDDRPAEYLIATYWDRIHHRIRDMGLLQVWQYNDDGTKSPNGKFTYTIEEAIPVGSDRGTAQKVITFELTTGGYIVE